MEGSKIHKCFLYFFLFLFLLIPSCVATKEKTYINDLPKIDQTEQQRLNDINILVDKNNTGRFRTSIVLNQDVSMFNTATQDNNPYMFVTAISGDNIDDLVFKDLQFDCFPYNLQSMIFVCTFVFDVSANTNWEYKNIVREVHSITYSIFDTKITSPVLVKIHESIESTELVNSSPIFKNVDFKTQYSSYGKTYNYLLALNWDYLGFGTDQPNENKKIYIRNLTFHYNLLKLEKAFLIFDNLNGKKIEPPIEDEIGEKNPNYQLTSEQAYWSGNFLSYYVSFNSDNTSYRQISDFLEMEYSVNDSKENKKVILSSVQLYDFLKI